MVKNKIIEIGRNFRDFIFGIILGVTAAICFSIIFSPIISIIFPHPPILTSVNLETAKANGCQMLQSLGCGVSPQSIQISSFDANKDGIMDSKDTLFELCKNYYLVEDDDRCKRYVCGCS